MKSDFDVVVIGAGVAGISAAIYLKRANMKVVIIEKNIPGGQINNTTVIENYPGFTEISGTDLAMKLYDQVQALDIPIIFDQVKEVINQQDNKEIVLKNHSIECKAIVIATGRKPKTLGLENEEKLIGRGISYCAICDGSLYKDSDVAVIGGGNSAFKEAEYLATLANKVYLIHRRDEFRGETEMEKKILATPNIEIKYNSIITALKDDNNKLNSITILNKQTNEEEEIFLAGLFVDIGSEPDTMIFTDLKILDDRGYILVDKDMQTTIDWIFAAGDVIKKDVYQVVTAASEGAIAALSCVKYLKQNS